MFALDPMGMLLTLVGLPLVFLPQMWVKNTYNKFRQVESAGGQSGAEIARQILRAQGIHNVDVELTDGELTDHYDPMAHKVRLSHDNYHGASVAALAIAAHEVGHAIQHARGFVPVVIRSAMAPAVNVGSQLGPLLIFGSFMLMSLRVLSPDMGFYLAMAGVVFFGLAVAFHIVTLPVELDASNRAMVILRTSNMLRPQELPMAKSVLTAAAMTYVATALYALMQLLYYLLQILGSRQRD